MGCDRDGVGYIVSLWILVNYETCNSCAHNSDCANMSIAAGLVVWCAAGAGSGSDGVLDSAMAIGGGGGEGT